MSCGEHKSLGLGSNHQARWRPAKTGFVTVTLPPNQTVPVESEGGIPARIALVPVVCVKFSKLVGMVDCWVSRLWIGPKSHLPAALTRPRSGAP